MQFALAICGRPPLLFLDEPTVGLDVEARETMWRTIRAMIAQGCSIVLTTHYLEEAEALADRVAVLADGPADRLRQRRRDPLGRLAQAHQLLERRSSVDEVRDWPDVVAVDARHRPAAASPPSMPRASSGGCWRPTNGVRDLEVRQAGLAEAFTELTKEAA